MGSESSAFPIIQRALKERAEDGGLYIAPVALGGDPELADIVPFERQRLAIPEQGAVEMLDGLFEPGIEPAPIHDIPEAFERWLEIVGSGDHPFQKVLEALVRQQPNIFGKHREQATHEEFGDILRIVPTFEIPSDAGEPFCDVTGDFRASCGGVERVRVGPDGTQPATDFGIAQAFQRNGVAPAVGELNVVFSLAGKISVDLDDMTDINDEDEGWPSVFLGKGTGVVFCLPLGSAHYSVPTMSAAGRSSWLNLHRVFGQEIRLAGIGLSRGNPLRRLLGLHDEANRVCRGLCDRASRCRRQT